MRPVLRPATWGVLAIAGACLSVTAGNLISKGLLARVEPLPLVLVQVVASSVVLWGIVLLTGRLPALGALPRLSLPGVFQPGLVFTLSFAGLTLVPLTVAAFLYAFETLMVLFIAWPLLRERPSMGKLGLSVVGVAGVVLLATGGGGIGGASVPVFGLLLVLGSVLAAAMHTVTTRGIAVGADPLAMAAVSQVGGLAVIAIAATLWPVADWRAILRWDVLPGAVAAGLLLHGAAMLFFNLGLARVRAGTVAILLPAIAPLTAAGAYLMFAERLGVVQLAGAALVLAAAVAVGVLPERGDR